MKESFTFDCVLGLIGSVRIVLKEKRDQYQSKSTNSTYIKVCKADCDMKLLQILYVSE